MKALSLQDVRLEKFILRVARPRQTFLSERLFGPVAVIVLLAAVGFVLAALLGLL